MKGKAKFGLGSLLLILAIIFGAAYFLGYIRLSSMPQQAAPGLPQPSQPSIAACPDTGLTALKVAARNPLNASLEYNAVTFKIVKDGQIIGTVTAGSSGLGTATNVECGESYELYVLGDGTYTSVKTSVVADGATEEVYVNVPESTEVEFKVLDSTYSDVNGTSGWYQDVVVPSTAISFDSGSVNTYYIKIRAKDAAAQFGSDGLTNYICADFNTAKFSKANGVVISGLTEVDVPAALQAQGMDKCWILPVIKSTEGEKTLTVTIRADLGDPGASDDIKFQVFDGNYYQKNDGTIGIGVADDAYTLVGEDDSWVSINIA